METPNFLNCVEGEIAFFRSLMRARPVGMHRHFHILSMRNSIYRDTGHLVSTDAIWEKLRSCYELDVLELIDQEYPDPNSPGLAARSPSPSENLAIHPFFQHEFTLPADDSFDAMISMRRMRATASLPSSSPAASPTYHGRAGAKRRKSKLNNMAGLVGGDSDSSALTQESGDDSVAPTPRGSAATGTDGGTEYADDDEDGREHSLAPSQSSKQPKKTSKTVRKGSGASRGRGASTAGSRSTKKKKK